MTIFKPGDLVEHAFNEERTLGIVTENHSEDSIRVSRRDGKGGIWNKSQCTVIARDGKWVTTIKMKDADDWLASFHSVVEQLGDAGVEPAKIAAMAFDFGKVFDAIDKNGRLRQILEAEGYSVQWI